MMEILDTLKGSYIRDMLEKGKRFDGRSSNEFRKIKVTKGIIHHAEGSAQVELVIQRSWLQ